MWTSNWEALDIKANEARYINFPKPHRLGKGEYQAKLKAHTPEGFTKSEKFKIKVD